MTGSNPLSNAEIEAIRSLAARLGVLAGEPSGSLRKAVVPTFSNYIQRVSGAVNSGSRRVYASYWRRIEEAWGDRRLDEPTPLEITQLVQRVKENAVIRANSRGGNTAAEHLVGAFRCIYRHAVADGIIEEANNPALRVPKPRRLASTWRALQDRQLTEIMAVASTTGNDPHLDTLLLRLHIETACRRGGALGLRYVDLDAEQCLIRLHEKGETIRWQPVTPTLMRHLCAHGRERGGANDPSGPLFRYAVGRPITYRRYDHLWGRVGQRLPWVATQQISTHWIRHTTLTKVERQCGYAVARAFAGHTGRSDAGTTSTYVRADVYEVAAALAAITGEPHPLAGTCGDGKRLD